MKGSNKVWVAGDSNSPFPQGFVGIPTYSECAEGYMNVIAPGGINLIVNKNQVFDLVSAPIDEKNIVTDWINEDMFDDCIVKKNIYVGFRDNFPVICEVFDRYLYISTVHESATENIRSYITSITNNCNDYNIVTDIVISGCKMKVFFYFVVNDNGESVYIKNKI